MPETKTPTAHELFPFPAKGLKTAAADFFADRPDILEIVNNSLISLQNGNPHRIRFIGERGVGKTSILDFIAEVRCPELNILCVLINAVDAAGRKYSVIEEILDSVRDIAIAKYGRYKIRRIGWAIKRRLGGISTPIGGIDLLEPQEQRDIIRRSGEELVRHLRAIQKVTNLRAILVAIDDADKVPIEVLGRLGELFGTSSKVGVYLAMGNELEFSPGLDQSKAGSAVPEVREVSAGVLAYWERVVVRSLDENEIREMLTRRLAAYPNANIRVPEEDMFRLITLCGGNGRLIMLLANKCMTYGQEHQDGAILLHVTRQVVDRAKEAADEGLVRKLRATEEILLNRDQNALRARWW